MKSKKYIKSFMSGNKAILIALVIFIMLSFTSPIFLTSSNVLNVLRQVAVNTVIAMGFSIILGSGHIDLACGSVLGLVGVVISKSLVSGLPIWICVLLGLLVAEICELTSAFFISKFALVPFIVTLATSQIYRGLVYISTGMTVVTGLPDSFKVIGQGYFLGIPIPVYIMFGLIGVVWFLVNRTLFGRYILAMGGNAEAARVSGIDTIKIRYGAYAAMGVCIAIGAVITTARTASGQISAGVGMEQDAIASCVIGGTSMKGGKVNVIGALFGSLIVGMIANGMNLLRIDTNWQVVVKGALILVAVVFDAISGTTGKVKKSK